ncbi:alpha-1,2-fucosyltransferase [Brachybacterium sp. AOP25-B2-12]|uniref:alpha-1,2-fucosyltransferase n=1 Tax=Brachybacterium sp. AOP25-B2-12 TaxID=3457710 RepID=UPI004033F41D
MSIDRHRMVGALRDHVLAPVGRLLGAPQVQITSPNTRGGNALYYWLRAWTLDAPRHPCRILLQDNFAEWPAEFPLLEHLSTRKQDVPRLLTQWLGDRYDLIGVHFSRQELDGFCRALVASSPSFRARRARARAQIPEGTCVINVRRGDYYRVPELEAMYGMDVPGFVRAALELTEPAAHHVLVSDDPAWCLEHVAPMVPGTVATLDRRDLFDDLAALSVARTLILANSTFSFWGAHLGAALGDLRTCVAPPFHFRHADGTEDAQRFDPSWTVVAELPTA